MPRTEQTPRRPYTPLPCPICGADLAVAGMEGRLLHCPSCDRNFDWNRPDSTEEVAALHRAIRRTHAIQGVVFLIFVASVALDVGSAFPDNPLVRASRIYLLLSLCMGIIVAVRHNNLKKRLYGALHKYHLLVGDGARRNITRDATRGVNTFDG